MYWAFVHRYGDLWTYSTVASFVVRTIIIIIVIFPHPPRYTTIHWLVKRFSGRLSFASRS